MIRNALMLFAALALSPALAQETVKGSTEAVKITGKITAVDAAARTVTVVGPKGRAVTLVAGDNVKNFAQIKVGDELVLRYAESVSVALEKSTADRSMTQTSSGPMTAPPGAMPAVGGHQDDDARRQRPERRRSHPVGRAGRPERQLRRGQGQGPRGVQAGQGQRQGENHLHRGDAAERRDAEEVADRKRGPIDPGRAFSCGARALGFALRAQTVERRAHRQRLRVDLDVDQRRTRRRAARARTPARTRRCGRTVSPAAP